MLLFHIPQCNIPIRNVQISALNDVTFSILNGALWDVELVDFGICEVGLSLHHDKWMLDNQTLLTTTCLSQL